MCKFLILAFWEKNIQTCIAQIVFKSLDLIKGLISLVYSFLLIHPVSTIVPPTPSLPLINTLSTFLLQDLIVEDNTMENQIEDMSLLELET